MKKIVVDTNFFLRFILDDLPEQKKISEKFLKQAKANQVKLFVAQIVIFEIDFILEKYYHISKSDVIEKLKALVSTQFLEIESKEIFLSALTLYSSENVSFVDCFLLAKAKIEGRELFTFDQKLQKLNR